MLFSILYDRHPIPLSSAKSIASFPEKLMRYGRTGRRSAVRMGKLDMVEERQPANTKVQINSFPLEEVATDLESLSSGERVWEALRRPEHSLHEDGLLMERRPYRFRLLQ